MAMVKAAKVWLIRRLQMMEAAGALLLAWVLVFFLPFHRTASFLGKMAPPVGGPANNAAKGGEPGHLGRATAVTRRIAYLSRRQPSRCTCLVQAIAGLLLLARRGIGPVVIRFGVDRAGTGLEAHAWLVLGDEILLGADTAGRFTPLGDLIPGFSDRG